VIPIADEIRSHRVPLVTYGLIMLNVVVFLYELMPWQSLDALFASWGAVPAHIADPLHYPLAPLTLFTSMFLHAGWTHLVGNMLYLWIFGDNVEDALGSVGYVLFYVAAGVAAGLAQVLVAPSSLIPAVGASGAIAGVLAVYVVLFPAAPVRVLIPGYYLMRVARVPALVVLGMWFVLQLFNGFLSLGAQTLATGGVAWFAHIGGFVLGLVVGVAVRLLRR